MNQEQQREANEEFLAKDRLFAKGVAQGLPQSYFFGNLCMAYIRKEIVAADMFKGKDYFYVDDSVIYVKGFNEKILEVKAFNKKITSLNNNLQQLTSDAKIEEIWENANAYPHESKTSNIKTSEKPSLLARQRNSIKKLSIILNFTTVRRVRFRLSMPPTET